MDLQSYLRSLPVGGRAAFARQIGVAPAFLFQMADGRRPVPLKHVQPIVKASKGQVTLHDLHPELAEATQ